MIIPFEVYHEIDDMAKEQLDDLENKNRENMLLDIQQKAAELSNSVLQEKHGNEPYYNQYVELQELMALCVLMNYVLQENERGSKCHKISEY